MSVSIIQENDISNHQDVSKKFGVEYFPQGKSAITGSRENDLYTYTTYIGPHTVNVEKGDCVYTYDNKGVAHVQSGPVKIQSTIIATIIRGYTPPFALCRCRALHTSTLCKRMLYAPDFYTRAYW